MLVAWESRLYRRCQVVLDRLNALYAAAPQAFPTGRKTEGVSAGSRRSGMLAARTNDGRYGHSVAGRTNPASGSTPPAFATTLGGSQVKPFTLEATSQFRRKGRTRSQAERSKGHNEVKTSGTRQSPHRRADRCRPVLHGSHGGVV